MSFGWSAGDIAQAVILITKVAKALDSAEGASRDYREAVTFLSGLNRTLEPLQAFSALDLYPSYGDEIKQHVGSIRGPIESFLQLVSDFETSLGPGAKTGRHRNAARKLQWRFSASKKVEDLRRSIGDQMLILDNLLHQLTLYVLQLLLQLRH